MPGRVFAKTQPDWQPQHLLRKSGWSGGPPTAFVWTIGEIIGSAVAPALVADLSPVDLRGLFQGVFGAAWGLAAFLGPLIGGFVFERFGSSALWGGCFALGCLIAIGYLLMGRNHSGRPAEAAVPGND